jgi:hypothetical protein
MVKAVEERLGQVRKIEGEQPNAPSVSLLMTLARVHESKGSFGAAVAELRRALDMQVSLTGPQSWEVAELQSEIGRLRRLERLGRNRLEALSRLGPTVGRVATGNGSLASAICIDPRGLFLTRARPLANLWRMSYTEKEIHPKTGEIIGLKTEYNREEPVELAIILNPGLPDQAVLPAQVVRTGTTEDLALLAVPAHRPLAALELARGHTPEVGAEVIALNHWNAPVESPFDEAAELIFLRACPTTVATVRSLSGHPWILLLDAPLPPGASEGPVLDGLGRLIGFAVPGLPGTGVSYTIPARAIEELLGRAVLLARLPAVSYRDRKREHDWVIPIWVADSKTPEIAVEVAFGEGDSRRSFRSRSVAERPGEFVVRGIPVDPHTVDRVDLLVGRSQGKTRYTVEDCEVSVGPTRLRLSELRRLELGEEARGFTADGRLLAGATAGLDGLKGSIGGKAVSVDLRGASSLVVVYPPESVEPVPGEIVVRSRGEVLLDERIAARLRVPLVDLGGLLDVSRASKPNGPGDGLTPARLGEDRDFVLEGKIGRVAVGGGGRYLLLTLPDRKELVVFDTFSQRLAGRVALVADDVLVAAGADAMLLVYPDLRIIHRFDLRRLALDRRAALPIRGEAKAVSLGSDSSGPMLVSWVQHQGGGTFRWINFSMIDVETLKALECASFHENHDQDMTDHPGEMPEPGVLRLASPPFYQLLDINLRASPRGDVWGLSHSGSTTSGFCTLALRGSAARAYERLLDHGYLIPGQDGRTVLTERRGRVDLEGRAPARGGMPAAPSWLPSSFRDQAPLVPHRLVPSAEPAYYLAIDGLGTQPSPGAHGPKAVVAFHALGLDRPLGTLEFPWEAPRPNPTPPWVTQRRRGPGDDQRFHWVPAADLLVVIPPTDDRLLLRRIRIDESLKQLKGQYLFISSPRGMDVVLGRPFRHTIAAKSGRGQPEFTLARGPTGLRVSPGGDLAWDEPAGEPGDEVEAIIEVRDASGRKITETIVFRLLAAGRATR